MSLANILWVDDEIESLQSQKMFLENKGYVVHTLTNGFDAIDYIKEHFVDVVLIDESMPGITGLETLAKIKEINSGIPVVLITKNETENLMDEAIGSQISDYLIKPVNPNQVWLSLKKIIDNRRLIAERTTTAYQQQFRNLFMALNSNPDYNEWMGIYKNLVHWELTAAGIDLPAASPALQFFLKEHRPDGNFIKHLEKFCGMDDADIMCTLKSWSLFHDPVLSRLSRGLTDRRLLKIHYRQEPFTEAEVTEMRRQIMQRLKLNEQEAAYLAFAGEAKNTTYNPANEHIHILFKNGRVADISAVDNALILQHMAAPVKKYYLCHLR